MLPPPQPLFCISGTQVSTNGTSQTCWPAPTSRVQVVSVQSALTLQNWKQRAKQPSSRQTSPGAQLSVCAPEPFDSIVQDCMSPLANPIIRGSLQVRLPAVLTEHFSRQGAAPSLPVQPL